MKLVWALKCSSCLVAAWSFWGRGRCRCFLSKDMDPWDTVYLLWRWCEYLLSVEALLLSPWGGHHALGVVSKVVSQRPSWNSSGIMWTSNLDAVKRVAGWGKAQTAENSARLTWPQNRKDKNSSLCLAGVTGGNWYLCSALMKTYLATATALQINALQIVWELNFFSPLVVVCCISRCKRFDFQGNLSALVRWHENADWKM